MKTFFPLAPRYRMEDSQRWLKGIDPDRNYWINVNGQRTITTAIAGLISSSLSQFKENILQFRSLQEGQTMTVERIGRWGSIHCISKNCYAIEDTVNGAALWHLFDKETIESLLMTSHPNWKCSPKDLDLGRQTVAVCCLNLSAAA